MGTNALAAKERVMPTHFTPTRLTIALVIVVLTGIGFKQTLLNQTLLAQHVGAVTTNAGLEISPLPEHRDYSGVLVLDQIAARNLEDSA